MVVKGQNNAMVHEILWIRKTSKWTIPLFSLFIPCPDLLPGQVQAVFTIQTRTSAPSTMTWSLQRAAAWLKNPPKSQTHRCSRNSCFHTVSRMVSVCAMFSICPHKVCLCCTFVPVYMCTLSSPRIPQEFSFALSAVQRFVLHGVLPLSLTSMHSACRGHMIYSSYSNAQGQINDSAHWLQSSF